MAQQTAVMKLFAWMTEQGYQVEYEMEMSFLDMEKEQIKEAFKHGELPPLFDNLNAEQYYNETYNK
jgi:hypothetical protein